MNLVKQWTMLTNKCNQNWLKAILLWCQWLKTRGLMMLSILVEVTCHLLIQYQPKQEVLYPILLFLPMGRIISPKTLTAKLCRSLNQSIKIIMGIPMGETDRHKWNHLQVSDCKTIIKTMNSNRETMSSLKMRTLVMKAWGS